MEGYIAFDDTRYKTGGSYTIRRRDNMRVMARKVEARSRNDALRKFIDSREQATQH